MRVNDVEVTSTWGPLAITRPCCLSCKRLNMAMDRPDEDEGGTAPPGCVFAGGVPTSQLMYGYEQCVGFDPRPPWDFTVPNAVHVQESGAVLVAPSTPVIPPRRRAPIEVTLIVPPNEVAIIVPPPKPAPRNNQSGGCISGDGTHHMGGRSHSHDSVQPGEVT